MLKTNQIRHRYSKLENLLRLAISMQASEAGISLEDIERTYKVSRRTAERMRDTIVKVFGHSIGTIGADGKKYWKLGLQSCELLPSFNAEELAILFSSAALLKLEGRQSDAAILINLKQKLINLIDRKKRAGIETDVAALLEAEGMITRPQPRVEVNEQIVFDLRAAVLARRKVRITYCANFRKCLTHHIVDPYGILYGHRHYLVAWSDRQDCFRSYTLTNIRSVEVLDRYYEAKEFCLRTFSNRAFGPYTEDRLHDVIWDFHNRAAAHAMQYAFHPTQEVEKLTNGAVIVKFRASGLQEMVKHLITWGKDVNVVAPPELKSLYQEYVTELATAVLREDTE
ncbi:MAG: WYL domain-containing protein [Deltaproteobacteria bacterium]|nr:WYL domain-containing protein [Deltaproteobacteria bacterium]